MRASLRADAGAEASLPSAERGGGGGGGEGGDAGQFGNRAVTGG